MQEPRSDSGGLLAEKGTRLLVESDETRRERRRNVHVRPVLAIRRRGKDRVTVDENRAAGDIVREHTQLLAHIAKRQYEVLLVGGRILEAVHFEAAVLGGQATGLDKAGGHRQRI